MSIVTPMTELQAVNVILQVIGEAPVNSIDSAGFSDAAVAYRILQNNSRETQSLGWHWNTDVDFLLAPNANGELLVPENTLKVDTSGTSRGLDLVLRGRRLYDRRKHAYGGHESPVTVTISTLLPFDEIPQTARTYITIRSARQMEDRQNGTGGNTRFTAQDEMMAFAALHADDINHSNFNAFDGSLPTLDLY